MKQGLEKLKNKFNEEPLQVLVVGAFVASASAKLIDALSNAAGRRTWQKEVQRRERLTR